LATLVGLSEVFADPLPELLAGLGVQSQVLQALADAGQVHYFLIRGERTQLVKHLVHNEERLPLLFEFVLDLLGVVPR